MNIAKIEPCSIANGIGVRVAVFVSGCRRHCKGCHNAEAWDFGYGEPMTLAKQEYIETLLTPEYIDGITILGGEPFESENIVDVAELCGLTKCRYGKSVWVYTGYTWEEVYEMCLEDMSLWTALCSMDVLVDGEYREDERDISLRFRGSRNQRIIDVVKSLEKGEVVLWEEK